MARLSGGIAGLLLIGSSAAAAASAPIAAEEAGKSFEALKGLEGEWAGTSPGGRAISVSYKIIANGTVLLETWTLEPGRASMTAYHLDNARIIATHYRPLGNQPRLVMSRHAGYLRLDFAFQDSTGMKKPSDAHQDSFWIELNGADSMTRSETYVENSESGSETISFERIRKP